MNAQHIYQIEKLQDKESSFGRVLQIDGPLAVIENTKDAELFELVQGKSQKQMVIKHLFNVMKIIELLIKITQIFINNTSSLTVGDPTIQTKTSLSVELGPGIFTSIFDGIQTPLQLVEEQQSFFCLPKGANILGLDQNRVWEFKPSKTINIDSIIYGGDIYGSVFENNLIQEHNIMTSPTVQGRVTYIAPAGNYTLQDKVLEVEFNDQKYQYGMSHFWNVRQPRPIQEKLSSNTPLITGIRVLDGLFSSVLGGNCYISGPTQCQKLDFSLNLNKYSNTQCMIYIGCAENENEMSDLLCEFSECKIQIKDKWENTNQRTCLVANPPNISISKRIASIYTGTTFAEYFRDMGFNVILIADKITKWIESQKQISNRIGQLFQEQDYATFLASKLSSIYERAGRVKCQGSPYREGSITLLGVDSSKEEDYIDFVKTTNRFNSKVLWGLDHELMKKKHFPPVSWQLSYSDYDQILEHYFKDVNPDFLKLRFKLKEILQEEQKIQELTLNLKSDQIQMDQILILEIAKIIREDFLFQNFYCDYDFKCPLEKTIGMMRCIVLFYEFAKNAILQKQEDATFKWDQLLQDKKNQFDKLSRMKFLDPNLSKQEIDNYFIQFLDQINSSFQNQGIE